MRQRKANDVACQPPDNRKPGAGEVERVEGQLTADGHQRPLAAHPALVEPGPVIERRAGRRLRVGPRQFLVQDRIGQQGQHARRCGHDPTVPGPRRAEAWLRGAGQQICGPPQDCG